MRAAPMPISTSESLISASRARSIFTWVILLLLDALDCLSAGEPKACEVLRRAQSSGLVTSIDCVREDSRRFQAIVAPALPHGFAARKLIKAGVKSWVVIHFPEAVYACNAYGQGFWQPSVRVPSKSIAGAAGAGDALAAGVLLGLHEDWPIGDCLRLGAAAAAMSLYHPTCSEGVKSTAACLALAQSLGFQPLPA